MKNRMICFFLLVLSGMLNVACEEPATAPVAVHLSTDVNMSIRNKNGIDLLDPSNPESFKKFKVYYWLDGEKKLYDKPLMDAPGGYIIEKSQDSYYHLKLFLNSPSKGDSNNGEWITYLEFEDGTTATIKAIFTANDNYVMLENASYNDSLVPAWDTNLNNGDRLTFDLIKE